jgi:hypothetical protein
VRESGGTADAQGSGPCERKLVGVQVPPLAPKLQSSKLLTETRVLATIPDGSPSARQSWSRFWSRFRPGLGWQKGWERFGLGSANGNGNDDLHAMTTAEIVDRRLNVIRE